MTDSKLRTRGLGRGREGSEQERSIILMNPGIVWVRPRHSQPLMRETSRTFMRVTLGTLMRVTSISLMRVASRTLMRIASRTLMRVA